MTGSKWVSGIGMLVLGLVSSAALAVPTLQVGVPDGSGGFLPYVDGTDPAEEDTAIFSGDTIVAGGAYGPNTLLVGGQFNGGDDWSDFGFDSSFDGSGAILMATVPNGSLGSGSLTVNGNGPIYTTDTFEDGFEVPNNHAPVPGNDYLFFDIGDFANNPDAVPNFADAGESNADGEVKELTLDIDGFNWVHFDVLALVTTQNGPNTRTVLEINPGSHDATWVIPEPMTAALGALSLAALAMATRRRRG